MANAKIYVPFTLFNVRVYDMRHLWEPSREYKGKAQEKPNYMIGGLVPKTRANWWEEPALAAAWAAYDELLKKSGRTPQHVPHDGWPIKDGDVGGDPVKGPADWMRGHWMLRANSQNPIPVSTVQNGNVVPLMNRAVVKPGDFAALGLSAGINQQDDRSVKHYANTVLFMAPGEEIAVGNSVSAAELLAQAQKQGLQVVGFGGSPLGGGLPASGGPGAGFGGPSAPIGAPGGFPQPGGPVLSPGAPVNPGAGMPQAASTTTFPSSGPSFPAGPTFPGQ